MSQYEIQCECGATVRSRSGAHYTSIGHLQASRIKALLNEPCITYTEIGNRLGISYERVRQYAKRFNLVVLSRRSVCHINQFKLKNKVLNALIQKCSEKGLHAELVRLPSGVVSKSQIRINGRICSVQKMTWHKSQSGKPYISIKRPQCDSEFIIWHLLTDDLWMIVPKESWPQRQTMFALDPVQPGTDVSRHDWVSYLDAWHLLQTRRGVDRHKNLSAGVEQSQPTAVA